MQWPLLHSSGPPLVLRHRVVAMKDEYSPQYERFNRPAGRAFEASPYSSYSASAPTNASSSSDPFNASFNSFTPNSTFVSSHYRIDPQAVLKYIGERKNLVFVKVGTDRINIKDCPFCKKPTRNSPDNQWKLTVWLDTGSHHCFRCGSKGSWFDFKKKMGDIPNVTNVTGATMDQSRQYAGAVSNAMEYSGQSANESSSSKSGAKLTPPLPIQNIVHEYPANLFTKPKFQPVLDYLLNVRGLTRATLQEYQIGACVHKFPNPDKPGNVFEEQICITMPWVKTKEQMEVMKQQMESHEKGGAAKKEPAMRTKKKHATVDASATPLNPAAVAAAAATPATPLPIAPLPLPDQVTERVKLRSLTSKGNQRLLPSGGVWNFFGWHTIPIDAEEIVITEGEFDAMAVWQGTGLPSVSLPNGARSLPVELLPLLEKFQRIYLWLDDDAAGKEGAEKFARKLGVGRCLIVKSSLPRRRVNSDEDGQGDDETTHVVEEKLPKDANDALRQGIDLRTLIAAAAPLKHEQILQFSDLRSDVLREFTDPLARRGVQSRYLPGLNRILKGHRPGELTIVTGATGVGKCWGRGTLLRMYDGSARAVEEIRHGEWVMGDDGTPRVVRNPIKGHTKEDVAKHIAMYGSVYENDREGSSTIPPAPATYRISPVYGDFTSWTCNGDHILVLLAISRTSCRFVEMTVQEYFSMLPLSLATKWAMYKPRPETAGPLANLEMVKEEELVFFQVEVVEHAKYFGFTVNNTDGGSSNGRLLMADGTCTHNTTVLSQISLDYCSQGVNTLWGSFEIRNTKLARSMISQFANMNFSTEIPQVQAVNADGSMAADIDPQQSTEPLSPQPQTTPPPDPAMIRQFNLWADRFEQLPLYFMKFFGSNSVEMVLDAMEYAVYVYDVEHILLDNLQFMLSEQGKGGYDRFELQDRAIALFRQFASVKNVHITLVIHPRKEHDSHALGVASIFGGAKATQEADNILIIQKPVTLDENVMQLGAGGGQLTQELQRLKAELDAVRGGGEDASFISQHRRIEVKKNRFDGELGSIPFKYDKRTCRIYEIQPGKRGQDGTNGGGAGGSNNSRSALPPPPPPRAPRPTRAVPFGSDRTAADAALATENANKAALASMTPKPKPVKQPKPPKEPKQSNIVEVDAAPVTVAGAEPSPDVLQVGSSEAVNPPVKKKRASRKKNADDSVLQLTANVNEDVLVTETLEVPAGAPKLKKRPTKKKAAIVGGAAAGAPSLSSPPIEVVVE